MNILFGPPSNPDDCDRMMSLFFSKEGKHIICGGTTSSIAAKWLGKPLIPKTDQNLSGDIPPMSELEGVDLVCFPDPLAFAHIMVDLNEYIKPRLWLCDAVEAMEGNGPSQGTPRHMGVLLAGNDPYELDRLCAYLLGIREEELLFLAAARERGLLAPDAPPLCREEAAAFRVETFRRSGATSSWFLSDPADKPGKRLLKKGLAAAMRSRPKLYDGCVGCGHCASLCPAGAITVRKGKAVIDRRKCVRCFCCQEFCPTGAMRVQRTAAARLLSR